MLILPDFKDQRMDTRAQIVLDEAVLAHVAELVGLPQDEPISLKIRLRTASSPDHQGHLELDPQQMKQTPRIVIWVRPVDPISERGWYAINNSLVSALRRIVHLREFDVAYIGAHIEELTEDASDWGHKALPEQLGPEVWALHAPHQSSE